jgi:peptidoglycan/LPS O-acetylase OafA/YrhL
MPKNLTQIPEERLAFIDVLRGVAILGVVIVHAAQATEFLFSSSPKSINGNLTYVLSLGKYGVELFFVISGYLLCSIYFDKQNEGFAYRKYFQKRAARILPLWFLFLLVHTLINYFIINENPNLQFETLESLIAATLIAVFFLSWINSDIWNQILPGDWSIHAELFHYLAFTLFYVLSAKQIVKYFIFICYFTVIIGFVSNAGLLDDKEFLNEAFQAWKRLNLFSTFIYFLLGMAIFKLFPYVTSRRGVELKQEIIKLGVGKILGLAACIPFLPLNFGKNIECIGFLILAVTVAGLIFLNAASTRFLKTLGKYSYFIYFFHFVILDVIRMCFHPKKEILNLDNVWAHPIIFALVLLLVLLISMPFGALSYRFIESPILRLSRKR